MFGELHVLLHLDQAGHQVPGNMCAGSTWQHVCRTARAVTLMAGELLALPAENMQENKAPCNMCTRQLWDSSGWWDSRRDWGLPKGVWSRSAGLRTCLPGNLGHWTRMIVLATFLQRGEKGIEKRASAFWCSLDSHFFCAKQDRP